MQTEETVIVALLHDLVEDTDYTIADLTEMGFDKAVTDAIALMTHAKGVEYMAYVRAIKENPIAKTVKLADLKHNADLTRLDSIDEKALLRREKYLEAIRLLSE
jgi:(p)ppGpp synthase/HD superfamily hydrolase